MVSLYVAGEKVGTLADGGKLFEEYIARHVPVEFRDDAGEVVGRFTPVQPTLPAEPLIPWDPTITQEDLDRIAKEPSFTFDEVKKQLGWQ
jgi:hypothetical protein